MTMALGHQLLSRIEPIVAVSGAAVLFESVCIEVKKSSRVTCPQKTSFWVFSWTDLSKNFLVSVTAEHSHSR